MAKFQVIVADPPWFFFDGLKMSNVKRGAASQYDVMTDQDIIDLHVQSIATDDAILVLWVPSSKLQIGLDTMKAWGFKQTQTFIWVKTKRKENIFNDLKTEIKKAIKLAFDDRSWKDSEAIKQILNPLNLLDKFDLNKCLNFYMGRLFRQTHEIALVGKKGKIYSILQNKSQRSVLLDINLKHSAKPEGLQDRLDLMFSSDHISKLELFARRQRKNWICVGWEAPMTENEDIKLSINKLKNMTTNQHKKIFSLSSDTTRKNFWNSL